MSTENGPLNIYAGRDAYQHIRENGLNFDDVAMVLGASSGPKWLVLEALDRFFMEHLLQNRQGALHLLGTSAGAWRMACYAQSDPKAALARLTDAYVEQTYETKPTGKEVLDTCHHIVKTMLGDRGQHQILANPLVHFNLITTQCHGLTIRKAYSLKLIGFALAALFNVINRKNLGRYFTRVVMHKPDEQPPIENVEDLPSRWAELRGETLLPSILSTGSIPLLIDGVENVAGAGTFQDGGITDYGFDLPFIPANGFVLYPHFTAVPVPGWFDKQLKWRTPSKENYSKTILVVPSPDYVTKLPYQKIPDRNDFKRLETRERKRYWRQVLTLGEELYQDLETMNWAARVQPLPW